jgi:hypothetical protein
MTRSTSYSKSWGRSPFSGRVKSWRRAMREASASDKAKEKVEKEEKKMEKKRKQPKACFI